MITLFKIKDNLLFLICDHSYLVISGHVIKSLFIIICYSCCHFSLLLLTFSHFSLTSILVLSLLVWPRLYPHQHYGQ